MTVTLTADRTWAIAAYGVGGYAPNGRTVELSVDPSFPDLALVVAERLAPVLAHELHHAARWRGPGYGRTLFEAMITEGLADHFSVELLGAPVPPWADAFPRSRDQELLDLARSDFDSTGYDRNRWFLGSTAGIPRWTGYTLGYRLVEAYQVRNAGATAASLVNTPAASFKP